MPRNVFITGTDEDLILEISSLYEKARTTCVHYTVTNNAKQKKHEVQMSAYAASLVSMYIRNHTEPIHDIVICAKIPDMGNILTIPDETVATCFGTELCFFTDMLKHCYNTMNAQRSHETRVFFVLPRKKPYLTSAQGLFLSMLNSLVAAIMKEIPKNIGISLLTVEKKPDLAQIARMVYQALTAPKPLHKRRVAIGDTWLQKLMQRLSDARVKPVGK